MVRLPNAKPDARHVQEYPNVKRDPTGSLQILLKNQQKGPSLGKTLFLRLAVEKIYTLTFLLSMAAPANPAPRRSSVEGSGTGGMVFTTSTSILSSIAPQ